VLRSRADNDSAQVEGGFCEPALDA